MQDNVLFATESLRSSLSGLKKKLSNLRISLEQFDSEIERMEVKFDKLVTQTEIYKAKVEREAKRETRRLEIEVGKLKKDLKEYEEAVNGAEPPINALELKIASTIGIFESILRNMCGHENDFRLMCYAFLFPAVYDRVVKAEDPAYLRSKVPDAAPIVIQRGREYIQYIRSVCDTHVTDPSAWEKHIEEVTNWWRNDALPLLYGEQDEIWEEDVPLTHTEMMSWKEDPASRPLNFSSAFDALEIYRNNKEHIYESSGLQDLDMKMYTFQAAQG